MYNSISNTRRYNSIIIFSIAIHYSLKTEKRLPQNQYDKYSFAGINIINLEKKIEFIYNFDFSFIKTYSYLRD